MASRLAYLVIYIFILITSFSCTSSNSFEDEEEYLDGTYCAEVTYYNPNTGTNSTYTLNVEVADNYLETIYWNNGGWLDTDHFDSQEMSDGYCSFTSDKGYEYTVTIIGNECTHTDKSRFDNDRRQERNDFTCFRCGNEKERYETYCDDCLDAYCSNCERFDDYKYYSYDLCSSCKENKERREKTCQRCGQYDSWMSRYDDFCYSCTRKKRDEE